MERQPLHSITLWEKLKTLKQKKGIPNVQVYGTRTSWGIGGGVAYTDWNGNYDLRLTQGTYDISFFAEGYHSQTIENVELSAFDFEHALETVYLTPIEGEEQETVFAQGKVLDSEIKIPLAGATVKFREGTDNQTGDYIQITEGLDITLTTDESGQYYTSALPAGSYTLEASKDGYVTGYLNIVSGNSDECSTQDILLTPVSSNRIFWNGHYYQVFDEALSWSEAKKLCEDMGGHLVTITSKEENDFILSTLADMYQPEFRRFWIGLYKPDTEWQWVTGEPYVDENTFWRGGEPSGGLEKYAVTYSSGEGWNDLIDEVYPDKETRNSGYICEWEDITSDSHKIIGTVVNSTNGETLQGVHVFANYQNNSGAIISGQSVYTNSNGCFVLPLEFENTAVAMDSLCLYKDGYSDKQITGLSLDYSQDMEIGTIQLESIAPDSTDKVSWNGHSYQFFDEVLSWKDAKAKCEAMGGHLATITSKEEQDFLVSTNKRKKMDYWVGGTENRKKALAFGLPANRFLIPIGTHQEDNRTTEEALSITLFS